MAKKKKATKKRQLTPKQRRFVEEYAIDCNATQAAIRAGYASKSANRAGAHLMSNPVIRAEVDSGLGKRSTIAEATRENVIRELARIAFADIRDIATVGPDSVRFVPSDEWTDDAAATVESISESTTGESSTIRIKQHAKTQALAQLSKLLGLEAPQKHEVNMTWLDLVTQRAGTDPPGRKGDR